jgi:double-stranded uracil-DNA glycosylase
VDLAPTKAGLPPIARTDARLFILGSLPGDASLAARQYYAHPTNQFWRLLGGVLNLPLQELAYWQRIERLAEHGVGLWDVIASAERRGSLDQAIRAAEHNPIDRLLRDFPEVRAIAFNGAAAAKAGRKLIGEAPAEVSVIQLPSSSAANTTPFQAKVRAWAALQPFVAP